MKSNKLKTRVLFYFIGLFIMTAGIAISVKSNLGVSPVSSIPYTLTCVWAIEMGKATILFHCALVLIQICLLRKRFQIKNLLQVPVGIVFGYFTTFCNHLCTYLPDVNNLLIRLGMSLLSAFLIALGIFFYMPANIVPLAGEGCMQAVSHISKIEFAKVKIAFDVSMVAISTITCLIMLKGTIIQRFGSVGVGTIIGAFLVGNILKVLTKYFGQWRDQLLAVKVITRDTAEII